jgi:hypothetical protein
MSRLCEIGERPEDMIQFLFEAIERKEKHFVPVDGKKDSKTSADYTKRERETIYVGIKKAISPLRITLRTLSAISDNPKYSKFSL